MAPLDSREKCPWAFSIGECEHLCNLSMNHEGHCFCECGFDWVKDEGNESE